MLKNVTGIASLPFELMLRIAGFLQASGRFASILDLISCALVCKHWLSVFRPLIYPIRTLKSREELQEFAKAVTTVPGLLLQIRDLELHENVSADPWVDTVVSILPRNLVNLRSITLVGFHTHSRIPVAAQHLHIAYPFSKHLARLHSCFGGITKLTLERCKFEDYNHLVRIVCGCSKLEELRLVRYSWKYAHVSPANMTCKANKTLRLVTASQGECVVAPLSLLWLFADLRRRGDIEVSRGPGFIVPSELTALHGIMVHIFGRIVGPNSVISFQRELNNG